MKLSPRRLVGIICACLAVLIACILIGLSVSIVPWNHLALVEDRVKPQVRACNDSTVHLFATPPPHPYPPPPPPSPPRVPHPFQIWDKVYGSGRHFIGVGKRFHTFPMDYRLVDFSWMTMADSYGDTFYDAPSLVGRTPQAPSPPPAPAPPAQATRHKPHATREAPHTARLAFWTTAGTAEGLGVSMAITVFSRIQREHLREMYLSYCYSRSGNQSDAACSDKVLGLVALYARAAIIDLVAETRTEDFFRERVRISTEMTRVVSEAVAPLQGSCVESVVHCLTTPPHLPAWCLLSRRPLRRTPERSPSRFEACGGLRSSPQVAPKLRMRHGQPPGSPMLSTSCRPTCTRHADLGLQSPE